MDDGHNYIQRPAFHVLNTGKVADFCGLPAMIAANIAGNPQKKGGAQNGDVQRSWPEVSDKAKPLQSSILTDTDGELSV